jgi:Fe-S oxidoreductase
MKLVAENRWANAKHVGAKTVVTSCPAEYAMLASTNDGSIELLSLEEAVAKCL